LGSGAGSTGRGGAGLEKGTLGGSVVGEKPAGVGPGGGEAQKDDDLHKIEFSEMLPRSLPLQLPGKGCPSGEESDSGMAGSNSRPTQAMPNSVA
jgi:hypothetical protein